MNRQIDVEISEMDGKDLKLATRMSMGMPNGASAKLVNRTHRVVHERAKNMQERRTKMRSLLIPLIVSGGLLAVIVFAIWTVFAEYDLSTTGLPDANKQLFVVMMWCLPVSALVLGVVWWRRSTPRGDSWRSR